MTRVTKWQTLDGKLHDTPLRAEQHADAQYAQAVSAIAAKLVHLDKYQDVKTFIDENLNAFVALKTLKADIEIPKYDEDED